MEADTSARGQSVPLVALLLWVMAAITVGMGAIGERGVDRSRAQAAADAVALGVAGGGDAVSLAQANHVVLEQLDRTSGVDVVVRAGTATAAARAARQGSGEGLHPALVLALAEAEEILGRPVQVVSGRRSRADQERLWANRHNNPYPVAAPGTSLHERGLAVDVALAMVPELAAIANTVGLCRPLPHTDPVHFTLCRLGH